MSESNQQVYDNAARYYRSYKYAESIGERSKGLKRGYFRNKLIRAGLVVAGVAVGMSVAGAILSGIGFWGVLVSAGLLAGGLWTAMKFPKIKLPTPESIIQSDLKTLAGKTEIWLENQRPALPAPAVKIVGDIGVQLDMLSPQLQKLNEKEPAAYEVRKLVGEHLPELINGYRAIPTSMRTKSSDGGKTPDEQLIGGLSLIEKEIAGVTQQIAKGDLDNLSIRGRYLEMRYDTASETE